MTVDPRRGQQVVCGGNDGLTRHANDKDENDESGRGDVGFEVLLLHGVDGSRLDRCSARLLRADSRVVRFRSLSELNMTRRLFVRRVSHCAALSERRGSPFFTFERVGRRKQVGNTENALYLPPNSAKIVRRLLDSRTSLFHVASTRWNDCTVSPLSRIGFSAVISQRIGPKAAGK